MMNVLVFIAVYDIYANCDGVVVRVVNLVDHCECVKLLLIKIVVVEIFAFYDKSG